MAVVDLAVLAIFYWRIPEMRRPFEALLVLATVLALATAAAGRSFWRGALVVVAAVAVSLFALEMAQKLFNVMNVMTTRDAKDARTHAGRYVWRANNITEYREALRNARADGVVGVDEENFPGDVFRDVDPSVLVVTHARAAGGTNVLETKGQVYRAGPPLGYELLPGGELRMYAQSLPDGAIIHDGHAVMDNFGFRRTRNNRDSEDAYVFMGCSFTFGAFLNNDETLPYYFSQALDFDKRVVNLGVNGYGPNQALRDLETDHHLGRAGIGPERVRMVVYSLIDDHADRLDPTRDPEAPYYRLENGELHFAGAYREYADSLGRLSIMMNRSRIYPILRERFRHRIGAGEIGYNWRLTAAVLARMDQICRERYGVPLTLFYWDEDPAVSRLLAESGLSVITASDVFGADWFEYKIRYYLFDYHPAAFANRVLGEFLAADE